MPGGEEVAQGLVEPRMDDRRSNLKHRNQRKRTLMKPQMGHDEVRLADDVVPKEEQIKIEGSIGPSSSRSTAEAHLDFLADPQQGAGRQGTLQPYRSVEEDLARGADGHRSPDTADRGDLEPRVGIQRLDRQLKHPLPIAQGAPQSDDGRLSQTVPRGPSASSAHRPRPRWRAEHRRCRCE